MSNQGREKSPKSRVVPGTRGPLVRETRSLLINRTCAQGESSWGRARSGAPWAWQFYGAPTIARINVKTVKSRATIHRVPSSPIP